MKEKTESECVMGEIVKFELGCKHCENLSRIDKNTYVCLALLHNDDSDVIPVKDGRKTDDWCACDGDDFVRTLNKKHLHVD